MDTENAIMRELLPSILLRPTWRTPVLAIRTDGPRQYPDRLVIPTCHEIMLEVLLEELAVESRRYLPPDLTKNPRLP